SAAAAIVGHVAEGHDVHAVVSRPASGTAAPRTEDLRQYREATARTAASSGRKWKGHRRWTPWCSRTRRTPNRIVRFAIDSHGINQHFALPNLLLELPYAGVARRVVAV